MAPAAAGRPRAAVDKVTHAPRASRACARAPYDCARLSYDRAHDRRATAYRHRQPVPPHLTAAGNRPAGRPDGRLISSFSSANRHVSRSPGPNGSRLFVYLFCSPFHFSLGFAGYLVSVGIWQVVGGGGGGVARNNASRLVNIPRRARFAPSFINSIIIIIAGAVQLSRSLSGRVGGR